MSGVVVIGYGSPGRGDDEAGLVAVEAVRPLLPPEVIVRRLTGDGSTLLDACRNSQAVILIDAVQSGGSAGTVHRFDDIDQLTSGQIRLSSTHSFGLSEALQLGKLLGRLPPKVIVLGVEASQFNHGARLSEAVVRGLGQLKDMIVQEVARCMKPE